MVEPATVEPLQPPPAAELVEHPDVISRVYRRLHSEGRWADVEPIKTEMLRAARKRGLPRLEAQAWAYSEIDRLYPPLPTLHQQNTPGATQAASGQSDPQAHATTQDAGHSLGGNGEGQAEGGSGAGARGLGLIPPDWPELPANASLSVEIAWVQAERLRVVEEQPGKPAIVRLERARSPAPSWSALAWLETSIRSYAKYVEVAAKAAGAGQDEQEQVRRERMQIEEIRSLLAEMLEAQ